MSTYEQALQEALGQGEPVLRGTADMYVGLSELHREQNDLHTATELLLRSKEVGVLAELSQNRYRWRVAMARIREAQGDLDGALDLLGEAERRYVSDFFPNVRPVPAVKVRVWVVQGRLGEALGWARERGLSVADDLSYLREFEHITLARVLLARYATDRAERSIQEVTRLLERLLRAAEEGQRTGSVIEILVVQALAHQMRGDMRAGPAVLQRAVTLAETEGGVATSREVATMVVDQLHLDAPKPEKSGPVAAMAGAPASLAPQPTITSATAPAATTVTSRVFSSPVTCSATTACRERTRSRTEKAAQRCRDAR